MAREGQGPEGADVDLDERPARPGVDAGSVAPSADAFPPPPHDADPVVDGVSAGPGIAVPSDDEEWEAAPAPVKEHAKRGSLRFDGLRLNGFKSFPDPVDLAIRPGMTGVVGPNGCGKSNLLEALRWVFGETSARNMRGDGMDDVIFGGTDRRPPRNVAEVTLTVDNRTRSAPLSMNDSDALEIVRRIERGQGTSYRINGKAARLRDVQILFQDNAAGARSSAIVSQGRVGSLISAKPEARKSVLEEAAGVAGLTARRHDTTLRIKGTEANLNRAEDALAQSSETLTSLRRQAKQAQRRREIDGRIREALAAVLLVRRVASDEALRSSARDHEANEGRVQEAILAARNAARVREDAALSLPALRAGRDGAETARAKAVARVEGIGREAERSRREIDEIARRLIELGADRKREDDAHSEAEASLRRLREERTLIVERREDEAVHMEDASDAVEEARARVEAADALVAKLAGDVAAREANHAAALRAKDEARLRLEAVEARLAKAQAALADAGRHAPAGDAVQAAASALAEAQGRLSATALGQVEAEDATLLAREAETDAQDRAARAASSLGRLRAESDGLGAADAGDTARPVSALCRVEPGYEAALAAALGESLGYGVEPSESAGWTAKAAAAPTTAGHETLAERVDGPVKAAAAAVLVVGDERLARLRIEGVPFGFVAVTTSGSFARWDGFAGRLRSDAIEGRLRRANRIRALAAQIADGEPALAEADRALASAKAAVAAAQARETNVKGAHRTAYADVDAARDALARIDRAGEEARRGIAVAEADVGTARAARQEATVALSTASDALASIPPDDEATAAHARAKRAQSECREAEGKARVGMERIMQEVNQRRARFEAVVREEAAATQRRDQAKARRLALTARTEEEEASLREVRERPASSPEAGEEARDALADATEAATAAARLLAEGEAARDASDEGLRTAESALAVLREARVRTLAAIEAAQQSSRSVDEAVRDRMATREGHVPDASELAAISGLDPALPHDLAAAEARHSRLERERENLGAVNFLAEAELADQERRYGDIQKAREELRQALGKLKQAVNEIDREARAKLEEAFTRIDASFGRLFEVLFSGGEAHLRLVGSDDILSAGLEIFASPPGKRLQVLSLLSGGEQALTAMALIFAAFQSNPAPICVLDEVDAPLDDANADRLCRLVEAMAANDATRFLIVTHNPLTMARMDRLFGVTMGERGVSSLTNVDLALAMEIAEAPG